MKVKKIICIFTMITMLVALLPSVPAVAYVDSTVRFKRVTSADDLVVGAKYLIVGCHGNETDGYQYYALGDQIFSDPQDSGLRSPAELKVNADGTLSALDKYEVSVYPLLMELSKQYATSENKYSFQIDTGRYLNAFYYQKKAYEFSDKKSKSLPIGGANGVSDWEPIFRSDGTVLLKTTKTYSSVEKAAYIRFFHYQSGDMILPAFSGGMINDANIDLPLGEDGNPAMTTGDLTEANIPVKTYLYKEVCAHSAANLTHYAEKASTCSEQGNYEYYYCSYCYGYLDKDKKEITLADTVIPLAPHGNTEYVPAKEATCTEHGNIAYTKCKDCGKYFEGNSTNTEIDKGKVGIPAINHSYSVGVCSVCGAEVAVSYFGNNSSGDGSHKIFTARYNGKAYAMGIPNENGMAAVEITEEFTDIFKASNDTSAFAVFEDGDVTTGSDGKNYTPKYIKIGYNYLKNDSGKLIFVSSKENATYWREDYMSVYDDADGKKYISLIPNDGNPYFSVSNSSEDGHVQAGIYSEKCHHKTGLIHSPYTAPTCYENGMKEYWKCNVCDIYYSDSKGISEIWETDELILLALGAKDQNDDGICDYCGKSMPIFTNVTNADEIVMQNKYMLVAKFGESYYAMAPLGAGGKGGSEDETLLPAVKITLSEDGTFKYKNADDENAFIFTTEFANDCIDLDNGEIRYSLQGMFDGKVYSLADANGHFWRGDAYAKYGYRLGLNDNGTAKLQSVYSEAWTGTDNGYLRFYSIDGQKGFSILGKDHYKGTAVNECEVYLYRMTENGTVTHPSDNSKRVRYTLNDAASTKSNFTVITGEKATEAQNSAVNLSTVSGMSEALTQEAINNALADNVTEWNGTVKIDTNVNIAVKAYTEGNEKEGTGSTVTFTLTPTMSVNNIPVTVNDSYFNKRKLMNVSVYVGNMYPQEIIHLKEDGTKEYFYPSYHAKVISGNAKPFSISSSSAGNWVTFGVSEFSDVVVNEIESISVFTIDDYDGKTAIISCPEAGEYTTVFVDYEGNILNKAKIVAQKFSSGVNYVNKPKDIEMSAGDKIFLWKDMKSIQPLCEAYTVK